jgi:antitoxin component YwqK of YwqJK toxin-antitoxin module
MNLKIIIIASLITLSSIATCQTETDLNKTDQEGKKQGHWIRRYPDKNIMYDGYFKNNHPVGEFKRYYENQAIKSLLIYNDDATVAEATLFFPNGNIASKGMYINQKKEGKWQFYSEYVRGFRISEEHFSGNLREGVSLKFYPDSTIAEKVNYTKDIRQGEWIKYYPDGKVSLKSGFLNNKFNGKFEVWFENGSIQLSGQYKNDARDGVWFIFNRNGTLKYKLEYIDGVTKDRQMDIDESDKLDSLEKNKGKIADPEKTGVIW